MFVFFAQEIGMSSVLLMRLGPIEDFIAPARRCREFWLGSWMLSERARAAATSAQGIAWLLWMQSSERASTDGMVSPEPSRFGSMRHGLASEET